MPDSAEDDISREKALQAVVAGNQAENLLDFDDEPTPTNGESSIPALGSGLGISSQAIASAAKSTNPLDELMDLFSTASMTTPVVQPGQPAAQAQASAQSSGGLGGLDGLAGLSSPPQSVSPQPAAPQNQKQRPQAAAQDDLLGLF